MAAEDLIEAYLTHMRERTCTQRTLDTYGYHLGMADQHLPFGLDIANAQEIRTWLWREGYALSTRALQHAAFAGFFRWAVKEGFLDFDPTTDIPRPKVAEGVPDRKSVV